jgi:cytochrome c oxidase assembly protein subunit 15
MINVLLLAPVWMQITHLFIADSLWIALVLLIAEMIAFGGRSVVAAGAKGLSSRRLEADSVSPVRD